MGSSRQQMGDLLRFQDVPGPGDPSTRLQSNDAPDSPATAGPDSSPPNTVGMGNRAVPMTRRKGKH